MIFPPTGRPGRAAAEGPASSHSVNYVHGIRFHAVDTRTPVRKLPACNCQSMEKRFSGLLTFSSAATERPTAPDLPAAGRSVLIGHLFPIHDEGIFRVRRPHAADRIRLSTGHHFRHTHLQCARGHDPPVLRVGHRPHAALVDPPCARFVQPVVRAAADLDGWQAPPPDACARRGRDQPRSAPPDGPQPRLKLLRFQPAVLRRSTAALLSPAPSSISLRCRAVYSVRGGLPLVSAYGDAGLGVLGDPTSRAIFELLARRPPLPLAADWHKCDGTDH